MVTLTPKIAKELFNTKETGSKAKPGQVGFDNTRENIDPDIITKALTAQELYSNDLVSGAVLFVSGAKGLIAGQDNQLRWDSVNNRLGIGTSAPNAPLHVVNNSSGKGIRIEENSGGEYMSINVGTTGTLVIEDDDSDDIFTLTDGAPASSLFVDSTGKVGMGTSSPNSLLTVAGDISGQALYMKNRTGGDPATPTNEGVLFVSGGFLWYLGTSGTRTKIADA